MKLFGQFLIEEGLISKDKLVDAMVAQAETWPSLPLAVYELKLYTVDQQLDIFAYQATHFKEYRAACVEMGIWNEARNEHALTRFFLSRMRPLGDMLLEKGYLTVDQLTKALARYVEQTDGASSAPAAAAASAPKTEAAARTKSPQSSNRSGLEPSFADRRLFYLYCRHFNEKRYRCFEASSRELDEKAAASLRDELPPLRHAAAFIGANASAGLFERLEAALGHWPAPPPPELRAAVEEGFRILWRLREEIAGGTTEKAALAALGLEPKVAEINTALARIGHKP